MCLNLSLWCTRTHRVFVSIDMYCRMQFIKQPLFPLGYISCMSTRGRRIVPHCEIKHRNKDREGPWEKGLMHRLVPWERRTHVASFERWRRMIWPFALALLESFRHIAQEKTSGHFILLCGKSLFDFVCIHKRPQHAHFNHHNSLSYSLLPTAIGQILCCQSISISIRLSVEYRLTLSILCTGLIENVGLSTYVGN